MYILPRIQKTLFDEGSVRRHKLGSPAERIQWGTRTRTVKTIKTIFFNKNQFLECFFGNLAVPEKVPRGGLGGAQGLGSFPKKATLLSFVSVWGNRTRKPLALGPVCDDGHFLSRKVSF